MSKIETVGRHEVTVKSATFGESKNGTSFVEFSFEDATGASILGWLYLSTAAFERSVQVLRECFGFNNTFETLPVQVMGKKCAITTEYEKYEGEDRLKVKWINPLRSVIPLKDASLLKTLSAQAARIPNAQRPKAPAAPKADADFPTAGNKPF